MCAGNTATTMWRRSSRSARWPRRGAIRDVGRALNFTYAETDVVAKLVPGTPHITLDEALKVSPQLREMYEGDERVQTLIDTARALEGMPRNTSTHAAGVVITRLPVYDYVPLATNDDTIVTEYTMTTLEELGLLKDGLPRSPQHHGHRRCDPGDPEDRPRFFDGPASLTTTRRSWTC